MSPNPTRVSFWTRCTCSASTMITFAREYDIAGEIYHKEIFWTNAILRGGGVRLLLEAQITEEWQLKQFIGQSTTTIEQKQKNKAGLHKLSPE